MRSANSTLTPSPTRRSPSVLRSSVSGTTSNDTTSPDASVTVRHTPSIATESFGSTVSRGRASQRMRKRVPPDGAGSLATTHPRYATMPLNIRALDRARDDDVIAYTFGAVKSQMRCDRTEIDSGQHRHRTRAGAQERRDRPIEAIDESGGDQ